MLRHFHLGDVRELRHLGRIRRIFDVRARRHFAGLLLGVILMLTGSRMAMARVEFLPHALWDCVAYFIHAIGTVPLMKHIEPAWAVLMMERIKEVVE